MLDTVRVRSPYLPEPVAREVEQRLVRRSAVELETGIYRYDFTSDSLRGSFDARIMVRVDRQEWAGGQSRPEGEGELAAPSVADRAVSRRVREVDTEHWHGRLADGVGAPERGAVKRKGVRIPPVLVPCRPYMTVEGSVHKARCGQNVWGGPEAVVPAIRWFVDAVGRQLGVRLPDGGAWEIRRLDWAECYELQPEEIENYILGLAACHYPRRENRMQRHATGIFCSGTTTTDRIYWKGPELWEHDRTRLRAMLGAGTWADLVSRAYRTLRVETQLNAKKLEALGKPPRVRELTEAWVRSVHDEEVSRLLREGQTDMDVVRTRDEVRVRLMERYSSRQARALMATWFDLAMGGERRLKQTMPKSTLCLHKQQLEAAGVSWLGTNVAVVPVLVPVGFAPVRQNPFRLTGEAPEVRAALAGYRKAA